MPVCINRTATGTEISEGLRLYLAVWLIPVGTIGVLINLIAIIAILRATELRKKGSTRLTLSLLVSSTLNCLSFIVIIVPGIVDEMRPPDQRFPCSLWGFLLSTGFVLTASHMYSTTALSITRLIAMVRPHTYKWLMSPLPNAVLLIIVWGMSLTLAIPAYQGTLGVADPLTLDYISSAPETFSVGKGIYFFFIFPMPGMTPFITYAIMFFLVTRARRSINSQESEAKITQWQSGITRALFVTVVVHAIFWVPHQVYHILTVFDRNATASAIIHAILIIQFVMDPLIFMVLAQNYRKAGINFLQCLFCRENKTKRINMVNTQGTSSLANPNLL